MGYFRDKKEKILVKVFKDDPDSILMFENLYPKVKNFVWTIGIFIGSLYIFFRVLDRIGFEKAIIILLVGIAVYMRSWLKMVIVSKEK